MVETFKGIKPIIGENCYIADSAVIIGEVIIGHHRRRCADRKTLHYLVQCRRSRRCELHPHR